MNAEIEIKHETRLCKVDGKYGIFHLWEEQYTRPILDGLSFISTGIGTQDKIIFCDEQSDYLAQLNELYGGTKKGENK